MSWKHHFCFPRQRFEQKYQKIYVCLWSEMTPHTHTHAPFYLSNWVLASCRLHAWNLHGISPWGSENSDPLEGNWPQDTLDNTVIRKTSKKESSKKVIFSDWQGNKCFCLLLLSVCHCCYLWAKQCWHVSFYCQYCILKKKVWNWPEPGKCNKCTNSV